MRNSIIFLLVMMLSTVVSAETVGPNKEKFCLNQCVDKVTECTRDAAKMEKSCTATYKVCSERYDDATKLCTNNYRACESKCKKG